jgi:hypothetical protein
VNEFMMARCAGLLARRERVRAKSEAKATARKLAGLCTKCGERPPEQDRLSCSECLEWHRLYNKRLRAEKRGGVLRLPHPQEETKE